MSFTFSAAQASELAILINAANSQYAINKAGAGIFTEVYQRIYEIGFSRHPVSSGRTAGTSIGSSVTSRQ